MKRKSAVALGIVAFLFFTGLAGLDAWRVVDARDRGLKSSQEHFSRLHSLVLTAQAQTGSFKSDSFTQQLPAEMSRQKTLLAVLINPLPSGEPLYLYPPRSHLIAQGPKERTIILKASPAWYTEIQVLRIGLSDGTDAELQAVYSLLRQGDITRIIVDSLYIIAAFFLLLLLVLIIATISQAIGAGKGGVRDEGPGPLPIEPFDSEPYPFPEQGEERAGHVRERDSILEEEDYPIPDLDASSPRQEPGAPGSESLVDLDFPPFDLPSPESLDESPGGSERYSVQEGLSDASSGLRGLYNPETGIGWEDYLEERLGSELARARASGQDLCIAILCPLNAGGRDPGLAAQVVSSFAFRDMVFEKGDSGIAIILPSKSLEDALSLCQDFLDAEGKGPSILRMGLSSRNGREIPAEGLIGEAASALERALQSDDSPLVGFKADPERYSNYLSGRL